MKGKRLEQNTPSLRVGVADGEIEGVKFDAGYSTGGNMIVTYYTKPGAFVSVSYSVSDMVKDGWKLIQAEKPPTS